MRFEQVEVFADNSQKRRPASSEMYPIVAAAHARATAFPGSSAAAVWTLHHEQVASEDL
jgi:hypothetical protein